MNDQRLKESAIQQLLAAMEACCREIAATTNPAIAEQWAGTASTLSEAFAVVATAGDCE